jgi:insulysin
LVEDKESQKSAASLYVASGSLNDPAEAYGLAHFCEHMLFLGTKKFPEENHYSKFLSSHGGQKNAATGEDYTYYFFDVKNDAFAETLDIFSQFFKEPLFTESATEREMNAVDSEFSKNLSNEDRRLFQIEKSVLARKDSALNCFSTGNLATLNVPNIRELLLKYH